jgi:hypothetical protein
MQEAVITGGTLEAPGKAEGLPPAQFPVTPDDLKRRRDELREEYQRLAEAQRKLSAAEDREKQALQAISELSSSEVAAASAWAQQADSVGEMPLPDLARRQELASELAAAQVAAAARGR